jgi:hypothetical protein
MASLQEFKISYRDGSSQTVQATRHDAEGKWIVFYDGSGQVLRIPDADVRSIGRADVAERKEAEFGIA